jgi:DNA-binding CsgD family transcriptional regulator
MPAGGTVPEMAGIVLTVLTISAQKLLRCRSQARLSIRDAMSSAKPLVPFPQPSTKVSFGPRARRTKATNAGRVGLILLNSSFEPVYFNSEAMKILAYPNQPAKAPNTAFSRTIRSIVSTKPDADDLPISTRLASGRRHYLCRAFVLESESHGGPNPTMAVTVERDSVVPDVLTRFRLTDREIEAVRHLAEGLTSKEIAQRMDISPNTVKSFFRQIMIKMSVTTRAGVVGKLVHRADSRDG